MDILTAAVYDEVIDSWRGPVEQVDGNHVSVDDREVVHGRIAVIDGDTVLRIGNCEILYLGAQPAAARIEHDAVVIAQDGFE